MDSIEKKKIVISDVFCCRQLMNIVMDREFPLVYRALKAWFFVGDCSEAYYEDDDSTVGTCIYCCPWCGTALPKDFCEELDKFSEQMLGSDYYWDEDYLQKMPAEFQTDEWWRKRGLKLVPLEPFNDLLYDKQKLEEAETKKDKRFRLKTLRKNLVKTKQLPPFCCLRLRQQTLKTFDCENDDSTCSEFPLTYEPEKRRFFLSSVSPYYFAHWDVFPGKKCWRLMHLQIYYCCWCGKPLPTSLAREWFEIATKQFGVKDVFSKTELEKKLPAKFLTEEWWREKRL